MLGPELMHLLRELQVHVVLHTDSRFLLLHCLLADDLGLDRALCREGFRDGLALEPHHSLGDHRVEHPRRAIPRLCALFDL